MSPSATPQTLILCPPSYAALPTLLESFMEKVSVPTDIQMLDRLNDDSVRLPADTYHTILLPETDPDLLNPVLNKILESLKNGGKMILEGIAVDKVRGHAVLSGFLVQNNKGKVELIKPESIAAIPLQRRKKDISALLAENSELIDESTLLSTEPTPIVQPLECAPPSGKRRKACKNCSCGLKELEDKEEAGRPRLTVDELVEIDFTKQGKIGSCGNCTLGDAFRCSGCPLLGMPAGDPSTWGDDI
ncbi:Fe-S cluster assembly protein dre2 [Neolecta irregularis DAH-3]|uniref:Fe-S cluster assembly protein dre2 n=1 Tax=Neolecta irregularis (strain DAH-3) TaxID=1198029 RepID=A0A1U7LW64_NEOID|nr:Fe-S cluster assembly protein dre2 [Neolecta irregularis DAH-3]|eukprot:OLL26874.1 Fe-S cluster assembly protein dre2 [Neolecta irregularis DAH-3]